MSNISIIAIFTVAEENTEKAKALFESLLEPTRNEGDCLHYELFQDIDAPHRFHFIEKWASTEGLIGHMKAPHMTQTMDAVKPLLLEPPQITKLKAI